MACREVYRDTHALNANTKRTESSYLGTLKGHDITNTLQTRKNPLLQRRMKKSWQLNTAVKGDRTKAINSNYAQTGRFNCYFLQTLCSLIIITLGRADTE
jgi:hypothetical protein